MHRRTVLQGLAGTALALGTIRLPETRAAAGGIAPEAQAALVEGLAPRRAGVPVVAVVADADGAETTDFIVPFGVLARSGVASVHALAPEDGPLRLMPALTVEPTGSFASFEAAHPDGADYVIVPALHHPRAPAVIDFVLRQHEHGAIVCGICGGAIVLAESGLLDGRDATTHWYETGKVRRAADGVRLVSDRRYVVDGRTATTTGVTASIPFSLALVEAIGGRETAQAAAERFGAGDWSARHDSAAFGLDAGAVTTAIGGWLAVWARATYALPIAEGVDEIALALAADAFSRTYRSTAVAVAPAPVRSASGLLIVPDRPRPEADDRIVDLRADRPALALDDALARIRADYGPSVARFVALQLEYAGPGG